MAIQWRVAVPVALMAAIMAYISAPTSPHHQRMSPSDDFTSMFVFGDDTVDAGNIGYPLSKHNGPLNCPMKLWRTSDGRSLADFLAESFNLPYIPPHFDHGRPARYTKYGVNFAFSGCGIHKNTKPRPEWICKPLSRQVEAFNDYVRSYSKVDLDKSVALVSVGQNDLLFPNNQVLSELVDNLKRDIKKLVYGGLKNIIITNMPPLGCYPPHRSLTPSHECHNSTNCLVQSYNAMLFDMVKELRDPIRGFSDLTIRIVDMYKTVWEAIVHPSSVAIRHVEEPCCERMRGGCTDNSAICDDKTEYLFFDSFHVTERVNELAFLEFKLFSASR